MCQFIFVLQQLPYWVHEIQKGKSNPVEKVYFHVIIEHTLNVNHNIC